jgi:ADP-heptose:LPS heptosyltransferase
MDILKAIGIENNDLGVFVPTQKEAETWVQHWLQENNLRPNEFIMIHPGASDITKCWPASNFALLMDRLAEVYAMKIVLIGSAQTVPSAQEILRQARRQSQFLNLTGKTSLAQTVSLLRRARLLISNDSGPVHVAAGVGVSVISLFLRNQPGINAERWKPLGPKSFVLSNKPGEEIRLDAKGNPMAGLPGSISVDNVMKLTEQIFQKDGQYEIF